MRSPGTTIANGISYTTPSDPTVTNVQEALDKVFYVTPSVTMTSNHATQEKGVTVTNLILSWSINKSIVSQSINQGIGSLDPSLRSHSLSGLTLTTNTSYMITVNDGKTPATSTATVSFMQKRYWGTSALTSLADGDIIALSSEFSSSRAQSRTMNGNGEYIYFAYPSSFGAATFTVNGLLSTAWTLVTRSFINASGYSESYNIYRSNTVQNGTGISIVIS